MPTLIGPERDFAESSLVPAISGAGRLAQQAAKRILSSPNNKNEESGAPMAKLPIPASLRAAGNHILFPAVAVPGAIGGICSLLVLYPLPANHYFNNLNNWAIGIPLALLLGAVAGLITIVVFTNTDRSDIPRMVVLGFVAGFAFQAVLARAVLETTGADIVPAEAIATALGENAPDVASTEEAKKVDPLFQESFAMVSANQTLQDTLRNVADLRGSELEAYLDEQAASPEFLRSLAVLGAEQLVEQNPNGRVQLTSRGETLVGYLDAEGEEGELDQRDDLADAVALTVNVAVADQFDEYADNWYSVEISEPGVYVFQTSGPEVSSTDTVITLYGMDGQTELGSDDDGGEVWPYSKLNESLGPGLYYLKVSSFHHARGDYTVVVQAGVDVRYTQYSEVVVASELGGGATLPRGVDLPAAITEGERLHFRFDVGANEVGEYRFWTTGDEGAVDPDLTLFQAIPIAPASADSDDEQAPLGDLVRLVEIGYDDDGGEPALYSSLSEYLSAGTYFVRIEAFWIDSGDFTVRVDPVTSGVARN